MKMQRNPLTPPPPAKLFIPKPGVLYWRVKFEETVGLQTFEVWIKDIPAQTREEAVEKGFRMLRSIIKGTDGHCTQQELMPYCKPLETIIT